MTTPRRPTLRILGCRGLPAAHGGFETFAQTLALHLVARGWRVVVYGQEPGAGATFEDTWQGIDRVQVPSGGSGAAAAVRFDWRCIDHARQYPQDLCLTLGYNTALFCLRLRAAGVTNLINMDGIEWRRAKWSPLVKLWFWLNDIAACRLADHLVADHPEIARLLRRRTDAARISTIVYGAEAPVAGAESAEVPLSLGLIPGRYATLVARVEPENSVLEMVRAYSRRPRGLLLVVVGEAAGAYAQAVRQAAGPEVRFVGTIYDTARLAGLRAHALMYLHGHRVGGTNPSLVEALAAGNAVIAHDNVFNRWVAGDAGAYFGDEAACDHAIGALLADGARLRRMRAAASARFAEGFGWDGVLAAYENLLLRMLPAEAGVALDLRCDAATAAAGNSSGGSSHSNSRALSPEASRAAPGP